MEPAAFAAVIAEQEERERKEPAILIEGEPSLLVLKWARARTCIFYSGSGCAIYDSRPLLCRAYPFDLVRGHLAGIPSRACPRKWHPETEEGYVADIKEYRKELDAYEGIAADWNKTGGSLKGFFSFARKRIEDRLPG